MVWLKFALMLVIWTIFIVAVSLMLNFTGDCVPEVTSCGEGARRLSFAVLAFGVIGLAYYAYVFVRAQRGK